MPTDAECSEYIPEFLTEFQALYQNHQIQSGYKSGVEGLTTHDGMLAQVSEGGTYWKVLDDATEKGFICQTFYSLSGALMNPAIKEVISQVFGVDKDPITWAPKMKHYAFGN